MKKISLFIIILTLFSQAVLKAETLEDILKKTGWMKMIGGNWVDPETNGKVINSKDSWHPDRQVIENTTIFMDTFKIVSLVELDKETNKTICTGQFYFKPDSEIGIPFKGTMEFKKGESIFKFDITLPHGKDQKIETRYNIVDDNTIAVDSISPEPSRSQMVRFKEDGKAKIDLDAEMKKALAALKAEGRPTTPEELIPQAIPDKDNAALIYQKVIKKLKDKKVDGKDLFSTLSHLARKIKPAKPNPDAEEEFLYFAEMEPVPEALAEIDKGAQLPDCLFNFDYSKGPEMNFSPLGDIKNLTRILCATAFLQASDGNDEAAWKTILTSLRLAEAFKNNPLLMAKYTRGAQIYDILETIQAISTFAPPSAEEYKKVAKLLKNFDNPEDLPTALDGEMILLGDWLLKQAPEKLMQLLKKHARMTLNIDNDTIITLLKYDRIAQLKAYLKMAKNLKQPYSKNDANLITQIKKEVPAYYLMTRLTLPAVSKVKPQYLGMLAKIRNTQVGLAAQQYKMEKGNYPKDLKGIKMDKTQDPFNGKPLIYKTTPEGFLVYSIGQNLKDDKGEPSKHRGRDGDVVWKGLVD